MKTEAAVSREGAPAPVLETLDIEAPRPGEVLVRIVATGVCHTDIGMHQGRGGLTPKPMVLGHEGAGIVEQVGDGVVSLAVGDHVVLSGGSCGTCPSCRRNFPSYCEEMLPRNFGGLRPDGTSPLSKGGERIFSRFFGQSSFAQYAIADERTAVKVGKDVPLEILGPLGCGIITGTGAVLNSMKIIPGQSLAVFGVGGVGLSAVMAARLAGASRIIAVDPVPARLEMAKALGATDVLAAGEDAGKQVREIAGGRGVDFSLNTTPLPAVFTQAMECLATQGTAVFVTAPRGGASGGGEWTPAMFPMLAGGRKLQGIVGGSAAPQLFIPMLIDFWRQGRLPFDRLIRFYPFEAIAQAFHDVETGETIKPVLRMG